MATIINTPGNGNDSSGVGVVAGVIIALALVGLFIVFVLPGIRNNKAPADTDTGVDVNVNVPDGQQGSAPQY